MTKQGSVRCSLLSQNLWENVLSSKFCVRVLWQSHKHAPDQLLAYTFTYLGIKFLDVCNNIAI